MNLAVFASGRGSNLCVITDRIADGLLPARVAFVLSNNSGSGALIIARRLGIPALHLSAATHPDPDVYCNAILNHLDDHDIQLIVLAGFMKLIPSQLIQRYRGLIINIHPAPLPRFGGRKMYGIEPHRAVLSAGLPASAVCVHHVTSEYDQGPIIASRKVPVEPTDTPESLQRRAAVVEHDLYWRVIADLITESSG